jgi:hypothetical protein
MFFSAWTSLTVVRVAAMQPVKPRNAARGTKAMRIKIPVRADVRQLRSSHVNQTVSRGLWGRLLWGRLLWGRGKVGLAITRLRWSLGLRLWKFNVSHRLSPWVEIKDRHHHSARNLIQRDAHLFARHGDPGWRDLSGEVGVFSHIQPMLIDLDRAQAQALRNPTNGIPIQHTTLVGIHQIIAPLMDDQPTVRAPVHQARQIHVLNRLKVGLEGRAGEGQKLVAQQSVVHFTFRQPSESISSVATTFLS